MIVCNLFLTQSLLSDACDPPQKHIKYKGLEQVNKVSLTPLTFKIAFCSLRKKERLCTRGWFCQSSSVGGTNSPTDLRPVYTGKKRTRKGCRIQMDSQEIQLQRSMVDFAFAQCKWALKCRIQGLICGLQMVVDDPCYCVKALT